MEKYKNINSLIGKNIRYHRKKRGLTQKELAADMDLSFQQIQKYENGTNNLSISKLIELSDILKIKADELLNNVSDVITSGIDSANKLKESDKDIFLDESLTQDRYTTVVMHYLSRIKDKKTRELIANMIKRMAEGDKTNTS